MVLCASGNKKALVGSSFHRLKPIEGCFRVEPDTLLLSQLSILIQPPGERPHKTNNGPGARVIVQKS